MSQSFWNNLSSSSKVSLLIALTLLMIATAGAFYWMWQPQYATLYQELNADEASAVIEDLKAKGINYQLANNGSQVLIPQTLINETRLDMVSNGVLNKNTVGLELFANADYGMTEFAQQVNYQRAMQGELARTIMALESIQSARVHLTIPKQELLISRQQKPKASITLVPERNIILNQKQIAGIQALTAASVKDLQVNDVTIINDKGEVLSQTVDSNDLVINQNQLERQHQVERNLVAKVSNLIDNLTDIKQYNVSVNVDFDYNQKRQVNQHVLNTDETIVARKMERRAKDSAPQGKNTKKSSDSSTTEIEYLHGNMTEEIQFSAGHIKKISMGIILPMNISDEQVTSLSSVIAAAAGMDTTRGDRLEIARMAMINTGFPLASSSTAASPQAVATINVESISENTDSKAKHHESTLVSSVSWLSTINKETLLMIVLGLLILLVLTFLWGASKKPVQSTLPLMNDSERQKTFNEVSEWLKQAKR
ncbi:MAG: flagellar basal-body MS-ring/collar protein FliF [Pseudomonadota bacterium]